MFGRALACAVVLLLAGPAAALAAPTLRGAGGTIEGPAQFTVDRSQNAEVSARLNGVKVPVEWVHGRGHVGKAGAAHGLRPGRNVLRVRAGRSRWRVPFTATTTRPLAGARDEVTAVGRTVELDARASKARPGGGALRYRWRQVSGPRAPLAATDATPRLTPRKEGEYVYALTASDGARSSAADEVKVSVHKHPRPLVRVALNVRNAKGSGRYGIRIGSDVYPSDAGSSFGSDTLQVIALDRRTLEVRADKTYDCQTSCAQAMTDVAGLGGDPLVLVAGGASNGGPWEPATLQREFPRLAAIGVDVEADRRFDDPAGRVAAIGIPGLGQGEGWQWVGGPQDQGSLMTGYLTPGNVDDAGRPEWTYLNGERFTLDTRAAGSSATANTMELDGEAVSEEIPAGGWHLVIVDRYRPEDVTSEGYPTGSGDVATATDAMKRLVARLRQTTDRELVALTSVGDPLGPMAPPGGPQPPNRDLEPAWSQFGQVVQWLGGSWHDVLSLDHGQHFSIVGTRGSDPASMPVAATSRAPYWDRDAGLDHLGQVKTLLRRDKLSRLTPDLTGDADFPILDLAFRADTRWPLTESDGTPKPVVAHISRAVAGSDDLRYDYWTAARSAAGWNTVRNRIQDLRHPGESAGFDEEAFGEAKRVLMQEASDVARVYDDFEARIAPLRDQDIGQLVDFVANRVELTADGSRSQAIGVNFSQLIGEILSTSAAFASAVIPEVKAAEVATRAIAQIAALWKLGTAVARVSSGQGFEDVGQQTDPVQTTAATAGQALVDRRETMVQGLERVRGIIASDPLKLATVAKYEGCSSEDTTVCPPEWRFDGGRQKLARRLLDRNARGMLWGAMLPARWQAFALLRDEHGNNEVTPALYQCGPLDYPFGEFLGFGAGVWTFYNYGARPASAPQSTTGAPNRWKASVVLRKPDGAKGAWYPDTKPLGALFGQLWSEPTENPQGDDHDRLGLNMRDFLMQNFEIERFYGNFCKEPQQQGQDIDIFGTRQPDARVPITSVIPIG